LKVRLEEMPNPPELVDLSPEDDPYRYDPMYIMCITPRGWEDLSADAGTTGFETLRSNAIARAQIIANGNKGIHPVFKGDCILIDNILVRKMPYPVRFLPGQNVTMDDPTSKTYSEVTQAVAGAATFCVERGILVGGQALMAAYGNAMAGAKAMPGKNMQGRNFNFLDDTYDFGRKGESAIEWVDGCKKITFTDTNGVDIDRGVVCLDYATRLT